MLEAQGWGILIPGPIQKGCGGVSHHHQIQALHLTYFSPACISTRMKSHPALHSPVPHGQWLSHGGDDMVPQSFHKLTMSHENSVMSKEGNLPGGDGIPL